MSLKTRTFTIPGEPISAPRMTRRDKWAKRPCVVKYFAWRDLARLSARRLPDPELVEHIEVSALFPLPRRPRAGQVNGGPHRQKPDVDNILKAVLDALFGQDQAIPSAKITKSYNRYPGTVVTITWSEP